MTPEGLQDRYRQLVRSGGEVAEGLERGQADTPLSGHFEALESDLAAGRFQAVLIGLTPASRAAALAWFYGERYSVVSVNVIDQLGLVEIELSDREFVLEHGDGERESFDRLDAFLEALSDTGRIAHPRTRDWFEPVRLRLPSETDLRGLTLLVPERPELAMDNPALLSRLVTRANLLIVAGPMQHVPAEATRTALAELGAGMDGFWPLLVVDELAEDLQVPEAGWWESIEPGIARVPPTLVTTHVTASMPALLTDEQFPARTGLFLAQQTRRLRDGVGLLRDALDEKRRQFATRMRREERKGRQSDAESEDAGARRKQWQALRQEVNEGLPALGKELEEMSRRQHAGTGQLNATLEQFLDGLGDADLQREVGHNSIKLTVGERFIEELLRCARKGLREAFRQETSWLQDRLENDRISLENRIGSLAGESVALPKARIPEDEIWQAAEEMLTVQLRYRGELPKRGFWARLREGRQGAMGFMMMIGIFAMAFGGNIRQNPLFGLLLLLIFVGTVIYTFIGWKKDDADRIAKELDRVRDGVSSELYRRLGEIQRDLNGRLNDVIENHRKQYLQKIDQLMESDLDRLQRQGESRKQGSRERLRQVEQQKRELETSGSLVRQLERDVEALVDDSAAFLRQQA